MSISIVVPSFNQAEYLDECLTSAYNQTVAPDEIIVVNDGSTDNSLEIAERYMFKSLPGMESPVRVINQVNKGLPSARNTGIMNATSDYILFLDADDMLEEHAIEHLTSAIQQTNADIIAPSFTCFGKSNQVVTLQMPTMDDMKSANRLGYFCAIRRSALIEVGGYNPKMKWGWEDYDLSFDLLKRGKTLCIVQEPLVRYRVKEVSMIQEANAHSDELWAQMRKNHPSLWT